MIGVIGIMGLAMATVGVGRTTAAAVAKPEASAAWQAAVSRLATPGTGCFSSSFPRLRWERVACAVAPRVPFVPARAALVGNGHDYSAKVSGLISLATGTFTAVSPNLVERDGSANTFSLQLNTQFFSGSPACATAAVPSQCQGWQQFIYSSSARAIFMQYWLLNYGNSCPTAAWIPYQGSCYTNSSATPIQATAKSVLAAFANLSLSGQAANNGDDSVSLSLNGIAAAASAPDSMVGLASNWDMTEWGVVGDGGGSKAVFATNTTLTATTSITSSKPASLKCVKGGFTGETNNLSLAATPALAPGLSEIASHQTNTAPGTASCSNSN